MTEDIIDRLDKISAILSIAFSEEIDATRQRIRDNEVAGRVLEEAVDWTASGHLQERVASATGKSTRTVRSEIAMLVGLGALRTQGPSNATQYRSTGLI